MFTDFVKAVKERAGQFAYNSRLYNWTLGQTHPGLVMSPDDLWPGYAPRGRWLCQGVFLFDKESIPIEGNFWEADRISDSCREYLHGFEWLRNLKSYGGEAARRQARKLVESWIDHYPTWSTPAWNPDVLGRRVTLWLSLFDFYAGNAPEHVLSRILSSLQRQSRHLSRTIISENLHSVARLEAAKGLVYAGVSFSGRESWLEQGLETLEREIDIQVLSDGCHVSRSPLNTFLTLRICCEVNTALAAAGYQRIESIQHAIDRLVPAVRFFRHGDKRLCLFHQSEEYDERQIDAVLARTGGRIKVPRTLGHAGYERVTGGRAVVLMDGGAPSVRPYEEGAHASPLAFEFSHGRERIFVNCGTHMSDQGWASLLRSTAAHNTLVIDDRNSLQLRADGHVGKRVGEVQVQREDTTDGVILDGFHSGYVPACGLVHRRRIYLAGSGCDLRGEDTLEGEPPADPALGAAIRFHLHPRVLVSLIQQGRECLLRTQSGLGWRFYHVGGVLRLENSVYLGHGGEVRKTKQIVLYSSISQDNPPLMIQWALQKEKT